MQLLIKHNVQPKAGNSVSWNPISTLQQLVDQPVSRPVHNAGLSAKSRRPVVLTIPSDGTDETGQSKEKKGKMMEKKAEVLQLEEQMMKMKEFVSNETIRQGKVKKGKKMGEKVFDVSEMAKQDDTLSNLKGTIFKVKDDTPMNMIETILYYKVSDISEMTKKVSDISEMTKQDDTLRNLKETIFKVKDQMLLQRIEKNINIKGFEEFEMTKLGFEESEMTKLDDTLSKLQETIFKVNVPRKEFTEQFSDVERNTSDKLPILDVVPVTQEMLTLSLTAVSLWMITSLDIFQDNIRMFPHLPILKELYLYYLEHVEGQCMPEVNQYKGDLMEYL